MQLEVTWRTKQAIRRWAAAPDSLPIYLDTKLSTLRNNASEELLVEVNEEFEGDLNYPGFPVPLSDWLILNPKTVREVRDEAVRRQRSGW